MLPDVRELAPKERCRTDLRHPDGSSVELYSAQNPITVARHFAWMRQYGIDGAALQRFIVGLEEADSSVRPAMDRVLLNVRRGAEATGRTFFVMYDVAGAGPDSWTSTLAKDWADLVGHRKLLSSSAYASHRDRPVVALAGVGVADRPGTAPQALALIRELRRISAPFGGVTIVATTCTNWRTLDGDCKTDPGWELVYREFDIISPWTVGRFRDQISYGEYLRSRLRPDIELAKLRGQKLMPTIFPGFSAHNLARQRSLKWPLNDIPRNGGAFLWVQASCSISAGATMLYGAMFDELDEGTALFKLSPQPGPHKGAPIVTSGADGQSLPSDWYLRISGRIAALLRKPQEAKCGDAAASRG